MIIRKYGIVLERLKPEHLELVREKRNSEAIRRHMFHQKIITAEEQKTWYRSILNNKSYYFLIHYEGQPIGVVNGKDIDYETRTSEGGIFIWEESYLNSFVPVLVSVIMADLTFITLDFKYTEAEVRSDNEQQLHYNKMMGYIEVEQPNDPNKIVMRLYKEAYLDKGNRIRKAVHHITKDDEPVDWSSLDFSTVTPEEMVLLYSDHPKDLQQKFDSFIAQSIPLT